jgi:hypothetical protein
MMRMWFQAVQTYSEQRLALQGELVVRGIPLEVFDSVMALCVESFEGGFEAGRKLGPKSNGKPAPKEVSVEKPPTLVAAMAEVMGKKDMVAAQIAEALSEKGWLPSNKDPKHGISTTLSLNPNVFERVSRGVYRVKPRHRAVPRSKKSTVTLKDFSADSLWEYLAGVTFETFTARELADQLQCNVRCLPSPLNKLRVDGNLSAKMIDGKCVYQVKR